MAIISRSSIDCSTQCSSVHCVSKNWTRKLGDASVKS